VGVRGEDMFVSYVTQRNGLRTFVYPHGELSEQWSSI